LDAQQEQRQASHHGRMVMLSKARPGSVTPAQESQQLWAV
jgi:hypothetical protein